VVADGNHVGDVRCDGLYLVHERVAIPCVVLETNQQQTLKKIINTIKLGIQKEYFRRIFKHPTDPDNIRKCINV